MMSPEVMAILIPHLKEFEGLRLKAYKCPGDVWTIGYGHTKTAREGQRITEDRAEGLLRGDLAWVEDVMAATIKRPLEPHQEAALASLIYNIGGTAWRKSTARRRLNAGAPDEQVAEAMTWWNKGGGKVLPGLVRRREAERAMYLRDDNLEGWSGPTPAHSAVEASEVKPLAASKEMAIGGGGVIAAALDAWRRVTDTVPDLVALAGPYLLYVIGTLFAAVIVNRLWARWRGAR